MGIQYRRSFIIILECKLSNHELVAIAAFEGFCIFHSSCKIETNCVRMKVQLMLYMEHCTQTIIF